METILIQVRTKQDAARLLKFSEENGWRVQSRNQLFKQLVDTAPKDVPLTDDDILAEIRSVRVGCKKE